MNWRLVDTGLSEPEFTVAADEAIAIARSRGAVPDTLHLYSRNRPTISLGYFQEVEKATDIDFCRRNEIRIVRRMTGGSAIYTDSGHLIYGLIVGEAALPRGRLESFEKVCSALVDALGLLGIDAAFKPVNDVLVNGRKISGSAQTRRGGVILQHGTMIVRNEPDMMSRALRMDLEKLKSRGLGPSNYVTSLTEILGAEPDIGKVKRAIASGFENAFGIDLVPSGLTDIEKSLIEELLEQKYRRDEWNFRR